MMGRRFFSIASLTAALAQGAMLLAMLPHLRSLRGERQKGWRSQRRPATERYQPNGNREMERRQRQILVGQLRAENGLVRS